MFKKRRLLVWVKRNYLSIIFSIIGSIIVLFLMATLFNMLLQQMILSPQDLLDVMVDVDVLRSVGLTLYASFLATLIAVILGTPFAYVLARHRFPAKSFIESIIDVPVIIPHSVAGIALYALLMRRGIVGSAFESLGIVFEESLWGIVAAMLFVSVPLYLNAAREGFQSVNPHLEYVARSLGAGPLETFFKISLPLAFRHLFTGALMAWARGISEFGAIIFIAFYPMVAPTLIYYRFTTHGLMGSRPVAVFLMLICFAIFISLRMMTKRWEKSR
ncbi:ABC transporter permease subunit [Candidatus Bathyarchaeota archaeon]|nr:MAG: ABC transporter permease subunit [Candidatus Bathyarchaeota archaeon]